MPGSRRPTSPRRTRPGPTSRHPAVAARVREEQSRARPTGALSRRVAILGVLALVVAVALSPFVRAWVDQRQELAALRADIADSQERVEDLDAQLGRWDDDAYVIAQARERFTYVMPGEVGYVVLDESVAEQDAADPTSAAARDVAAERGTWFAALWSSLELAAGTETGDVPPPEP